MPGKIRYNGVDGTTMKQDIDYKVPNGKLLRLEVDMKKDSIKSIKISGDFFVHPETAITQIEKMLEGKSRDDVTDVVNKFIEENHIKLVGFNAVDLTNALRTI